MDYRDLQHLDALGAQDIAAVAIGLLLITLAGLKGGLLIP